MPRGPNTPCSVCGVLRWPSNRARRGEPMLCHACRRKNPRPRWKPSELPAIERWSCAGCGTECSRPRVRGQKPKWCEPCRRGGVGSGDACSCCGAGVSRGAVTCSACLTRQRELHRQGRRDRRLPVLHPNPDPVSYLPSNHPARRLKPKPRSEWWGVLIAGPCAWCRGGFVARAAIGAEPSLYCSRGCASNANRRRFKIPPQVRAAIYERDRWICQLCNEPVDPNLPASHRWAATLDHIECQSWVLVPDNSPRNLRLAHRMCNSLRGDRAEMPEVA